MKPSLFIIFTVAAAFTAIGIVAGVKDNNISAVVWAFCTLIWISATLHTRIDLETQKRTNDIQDQIIKNQEDLIKCQKEIIKELEQLQ